MSDYNCWWSSQLRVVCWGGVGRSRLNRTHASVDAPDRDSVFSVHYNLLMGGVCRQTMLACRCIMVGIRMHTTGNVSVFHTIRNDSVLGSSSIIVRLDQKFINISLPRGSTLYVFRKHTTCRLLIVGKHSLFSLSNLCKDPVEDGREPNTPWIDNFFNDPSFHVWLRIVIY